MTADKFFFASAAAAFGGIRFFGTARHAICDAHTGRPIWPRSALTESALYVSGAVGLYLRNGTSAAPRLGHLIREMGFAFAVLFNAHPGRHQSLDLYLIAG